MPALRVLIGSPVRQKPAILRAFLDGLAGLDGAGCRVDWLFADDNDDPASAAMLRAARAPGGGQCCVGAVQDAAAHPAYNCDDTHHWESDARLPERVGQMKDGILAHARAGGYDACLLVDSDLVLRPATLQTLLGAGKDIVSEVFWTAWRTGEPEAPNVWVCDQYSFGFSRTGEQERANRERIWPVLRVPGLYRVGGLGACTLFSRRALRAKDASGGPGLRFWPALDNVTFWGEDRHLCIRAAALGLERWAHVGCEPLHLYRESDLGRLEAWCEEAGLEERAE